MPKTQQSLIKETILVERNGNWGPMANGVWYGVNEPLAATDFVAGKTYEVLVKQGAPTAKNPQGKKYISQIVGESVSTPQTVSTGKDIKVDYNETVDKLMASITKVSPVHQLGTYDEAKNRRILRQGVYQASLQSPAIAGMPFTNSTEYVALVKEVSEAVIKLIEG